MRNYTSKDMINFHKFATEVSHLDPIDALYLYNEGDPELTVKERMDNIIKPLNDFKEQTKDDVYYQPEINEKGEMKGYPGKSIPSFLVWASEDNLIKDYPRCTPIKYSGFDIEDPTYMDLVNYKTE